MRIKSLKVFWDEPWWFWATLFVVFFGSLGHYPLLDNNEGLYAQIPWEMLQRGNFIIPYLNGVPYIEKPPLLYWLISLSYSIFGKTVWAARLIPAIAGFSTCIALLLFGRQLKQPQWGRNSALLLATSLGFAIFSRMVFFDILLTALLTWSLTSFYVFDLTNNKKWLHRFYGFLALAVLAKGLLAIVLAGLIISAFQIWEYKSLKWIKLMLDPWGMAIFFAITVPWHVACCWSHQGFAYFYFINEHVLRFLDLRWPHDYYQGPWYYYIPRILGYVFPWTLTLPLLFRSKIDMPTSLRSLQRFLLLWFLVPLLFFSFSKGKANYYMIVGAPPLLAFMAWHLSKYRKVIGSICIVSVAIMLIAPTVLAYYKEPKTDKRLVDQWTQEKTARFLSDASKPVFLYKRFEEISSLLFYYGKPLPIIQSESNDLAYGQITKLNSHIFVTEDVLYKPCVVVVLDRDLQDFHAQITSLHVQSHRLIYKLNKTNIFEVS